MFGKNSGIVKKYKSTYLEESGFSVLEGSRDVTAKQLCYIIDRANGEQTQFLTSVVKPYIMIEETVTYHPCRDYEEPNNTSKYKLISINIPSDVRAQIADLYNQIKAQNLPTNAEVAAKAQAEANKNALEEGFKKFFSM